MKIQWPGFDAELVAEIEEYLGMAEATEIVYRDIDSRSPDVRREIEQAGVYRFRARGAERKRYCRPMLEVFEDGATSAVGRRFQVVQSCPECDDWSRTAVCTVHPELSLDEIRWHWQQARRWPDVYQGPALESGAMEHAEPSRSFREGERWEGDPEVEQQSVRRTASGLHDSLVELNQQMAAFGFEVSQPGEWRIDVA